MANCRHCGRLRLRKRADGRRKCPSCGTFHFIGPNGTILDAGGNVVDSHEAINQRHEERRFFMRSSAELVRSMCCGR